MIEKCFPFPSHEEIMQAFPGQVIGEKTYQVAKDFYVNSVRTNEQVKEFIRRNEGKEEEERKLVDFLVRQAVQIALFYGE